MCTWGLLSNRLRLRDFLIAPLFIDKLDLHAEAHVFGRAADDIHHRAHAFFKIDEGEHIGQILLEGRAWRMVDDGEGLDLAAAARLAPFKIVAVAMLAERAGVELRLAAGVAF